MNAENKQKHMGKSAGLWWGLGVLLAAALGLIAWGTVTLLTAPSAGQREIRYDYRTAAVGDSADADEIHPQQWRLRQFLTEQDDADALLNRGVKIWQYSGNALISQLQSGTLAQQAADHPDYVWNFLLPRDGWHQGVRVIHGRVEGARGAPDGDYYRYEWVQSMDFRIAGGSNGQYQKDGYNVVLQKAGIADAQVLLPIEAYFNSGKQLLLYAERQGEKYVFLCPVGEAPTQEQIQAGLYTVEEFLAYAQSL